MKTVKVNNAKDFFKEIHKAQRGYKRETYATVDGYVYKDGKCFAQIIIEQ